MATLPTVAETAALPSTALLEHAARAEDLAGAARAAATERAYASDWKHFEAWCTAHALAPLPAAPETVGLYLAAHAEIASIATLARRLSTLATRHRQAGFRFDTKHPAIRVVMRGLRRTHGTAQRHAEALTPARLIPALSNGADRLIDLRDRALLLCGLAGALRRSELVALTVADIHEQPEGLCIAIRKSKTDQEGAGHVIAIHRTFRDTCPVAALEAWRTAAGIVDGPVFRSVNRHGQIGARLSGHAVARIVKARAAQGGLDPTLYSGHSLRAGFATAAATAGVEERAIAKVTRHRSTAVLRRYIRDGELFARNTTAEIGL